MPKDIRRTTCVLDCPDACALEVTVDEGRITHIGAAAGHPDSAGFLCGKVSRFDRRVYHEDRILYPQRRVGAKSFDGDARFERISWEAAIGEITERFDAIRGAYGGEAILPFHYGGSNGKLSDGLLDDLYFARLGASRLAKTICAVPATEVATGMYGKMPGLAFADYAKAQAIVIWGANPKGSNIHLVPYLREAKSRGTWIAQIDPRRTLPRELLDLHLPVKPGADLPLALALIAEWERRGVLDTDFLGRHAVELEPLLERAREWTLQRAAEVSGVDAGDLVQLVETFAARNPAIVRCGWGIERNQNGAQAIAAVLAIPALLGKFVHGGGYTLSNNGAAKLDRDGVIGPLDWNTRELNMTQLGRFLDPDRSKLDPPIRALFVYNANPAATVPDQVKVLKGLARQDLFVVVHDQVMTDTARYADILLPAPTFLEAHDLRVGYGSYVVGGVVPVVEPAGEAKSNMQLFAALGRALGLSDEVLQLDDESLLRRVAERLEVAGGEVDVEALLRGEQLSYEFPGATPRPFETTFPQTADGRIHLTPTELGPQPYRWRPPANHYPLALITPASSRLITSMLGESNLEHLTITLHPTDAEARQLKAGAHVRVFNDLGEVRCLMKIDDRLRPGVASMPKGAWRKSSENGLTSTTLCPDTAQVVGDAACFNDARVEVQAVA